MDPKNYHHSSAGKPVQHQNGYWYFLPNDLPPTLGWSPSLVLILAEAERNVGKLASLGTSHINMNLLVHSFIRREAVVSTRIEGTRASLSDLYTYEAQQLSFLESNSDANEVHDYVQALAYGLERLKTLPISLRLIRELHLRLMGNVRGEHLTSGKFRRSQNWIGPDGCTLENAPFVPPPVQAMMTSLNQLEVFMYKSSNLPALVRIALIHYQFEAIHPFLDGNGRIGRLLIILLLNAWELLPQPLLYLSAYFEANRQEYYDRLLAVSQQGKWEDWLHFFLSGVSVQSLDSMQRISQMQTLYNAYAEQLNVERASKRLIETLDVLFKRPIVTIRQVESALDVPYRSAARYVEKFVQLGILMEITGQSRNRIFRAEEILLAIEGSVKD
ncbi:MAG TPA: Fic/DOC family N-terminal domain-containing protein [Anaerolineales bacterium]|nr:Fic/DOC family N-terminal domain-containing protein [Anaerolineales bacterium]